VRGPDECWPWLGCVKKGDAYGSIRLDGRDAGIITAHRASMEMTLGEPIPDGMCVLHRCDNPPCVNPKHLFLGTAADNVADMDAKGRRAPRHGVFCGHAKLSEEDVREILKYPRTRGSGVALARMYSVTPAAISAVRKGKNWSHAQ
jgi:hypothetical protein